MNSLGIPLWPLSRCDLFDVISLSFGLLIHEMGMTMSTVQRGSVALTGVQHLTQSLAQRKCPKQGSHSYHESVK